MRFDVIIGNPPYQLSDTDKNNSARPIYQLFVSEAKQLKPRYLSMIIPARWYAGGKGLDNFRHSMLTDKHMRKLVDYGNYKDVFPGVVIAGGVCYFLWELDYQGPCEVVNYSQDNPVTMTRDLDEHEVFIRQNNAVSIVNKIQTKSDTFLNDRVTARKPFGLVTNYQPKDTGVPCWFKKSVGLKYADKVDVTDRNGCLDKWKLLIPRLPLSGNTNYTKPVSIYRDDTTIIAKPGECCTESWIVAGAFDTEAEALSYKSYLLTKTVQFLLLQSVVSQHVSKKNFRFVPDLGKYTGVYTDERLRRKWDITDKEWEYIDSRVLRQSLDKHHGMRAAMRAGEIRTVNKQVKSRQRVIDHGEVFTPDREVQAMCDLVKQETERIDSRFLEPACGDGNFISVILERKLATVSKKYKRSPYDWERNALLALGSIYGVDIMLDNVITCRERLFDIWNEAYKKACKKECNEDTRESARFILRLNIVCGNTLTQLCCDDKSNELDVPIIFSEWAFPFHDDRIQHKDYTLAGLLAMNDNTPIKK